MFRRINVALVIALCAVQVSCAGPTRLDVRAVAPRVTSSPTVSRPPSPVISIYPVPHRTPGTPHQRPSPPPPADVPSDVTGIPCGTSSEATDHHVRLVTRYDCYEVSGNTPQQLQAWVAKEGPHADGRVAAAVTRWRLRWSYAFILGDGSCEVARPDVQVIIDYVLPAWTPPEGTSATTIEYWRNFSAEVKAHEAHHRSIAVDGGVAARKSLLDLAAGSNCPQVSDAADAEVKAVISQYEAKQQAFDAAAGG